MINIFVIVIGAFLGGFLENVLKVKSKPIYFMLGFTIGAIAFSIK